MELKGLLPKITLGAFHAVFHLVPKVSLKTEENTQIRFGKQKMKMKKKKLNTYHYGS